MASIIHPKESKTPANSRLEPELRATIVRGLICSTGEKTPSGQHLRFLRCCIPARSSLQIQHEPVGLREKESIMADARKSLEDLLGELGNRRSSQRTAASAVLPG